jgi:hypothetical protein
MHGNASTTNVITLMTTILEFTRNCQKSLKNWVIFQQIFSQKVESDSVSAIAEGYFAAVGSSDWETGFACGTCALLKYRGRSVVVNVVDR